MIDREPVFKVIEILLLSFCLATCLFYLVIIRQLKWVFRTSSQMKEQFHKDFRQFFRQVQLRQNLHDDLAFSNSLRPMGEETVSPDFLHTLAEKFR